MKRHRDNDLYPTLDFGLINLFFRSREGIGFWVWILVLVGGTFLLWIWSKEAASSYLLIQGIIAVLLCLPSEPQWKWRLWLLCLIMGHRPEWAGETIDGNVYYDTYKCGDCGKFIDVYLDKDGSELMKTKWTSLR
jgi:hypothetical protein